jgi:hypothetical protein
LFNNLNANNSHVYLIHQSNSQDHGTAAKQGIKVMCASIQRPACGPVLTKAFDTLRRWEALSRLARQATLENRIDAAMAFQMQALDKAHQLLSGHLLAECPDDCMAAWVVSHLNLADLRALRGEPEQALACLCDAHRGLLQWGCALPADGPAPLAVWRHLRETRSALLCWQGVHGPHPTAEAALRQMPTFTEQSNHRPLTHEQRRHWH